MSEHFYELPYTLFANTIGTVNCLTTLRSRINVTVKAKCTLVQSTALIQGNNTTSYVSSLGYCIFEKKTHRPANLQVFILLSTN